MKNFKFKKFLVIITTFIVVISLFSVICSADTNNGVFVPGDSLTFNVTLDGSIAPSTILASMYYIDSSGNKVYFDEIQYQYRGYVVLSYYTSGSTSVEVYNSNGWVNDMYRTIYFNSAIVISGNNLGFLAINSSEPVDNYYESIYNIIVDNVYGSVELTEDMRLCVSLISTLLSICAILLPIIVGVSIFIWILKRF